jgi:hypothetical protein
MFRDLEYPFAIAFKGNSKAYASSVRDHELVALSLSGRLSVSSRISSPAFPIRWCPMHTRWHERLAVIGYGRIDSYADQT